MKKFVKVFKGKYGAKLEEEINEFIPKVFNVISVSFSSSVRDYSVEYSALIFYENESKVD